SSASSDSGGAETSVAGTDEQDIPKTEEELVRVARKVALNQNPAGKTVAYQYGERNPDFNENGIVDFPDFILFAKNYGKKEGMIDFNSRYDIKLNGEIDFSDFIEFASKYGFTVIVNQNHIVINLQSPPLQTDFNEESKLVIDLEERISASPPDISAKPTVVADAISLDGKTKVKIDGTILMIEGLPNAVGPYSVIFEVRIDGVKSATATISGYIYDLAEVSVTIKNSETSENAQGTFWIYDDEWNLLTTTTSNDDGSNEVGAEGTAMVKLNVKESEFNENLIVQGGIGVPEEVSTTENGERTRLSDGYVRTVKEVESGDEVLITAVPYGRYADRPEDFLAYFLEQQDDPPEKFDFTGEFVRQADPSSNYDGLKKIIILTNDPFGDEFFTSEQQEYFKQRILDPNDINSLTLGGNFITEDMIFFGDSFEGIDYNLGISLGKDAVVAKPGVIVVAPTKPGESGFSLGNSFWGVLTVGGAVYIGGGHLIPPKTMGQTLSHEFGHIFMGPGHPNTLHKETVMTYNNAPLDMGQADKKQSKILNQKDFTYRPISRSDGYVFAPRMDFIGNIMNLYIGSEGTTLILNGIEINGERTVHARYNKYDR
ncbi:MAG: hypothetical protein KJ905_01345, partial [Nanoarchaeota archaeon]|nr:hypothetical protein [Nanoarchaeota archaeon]MBU1501404.1 hypothetical protein [Nanoarchaeota archaeon]